MNVGIIGCGVIGHKRAESLGNNKLIAVADIDITKAMDLTKKYPHAFIYNDYKELLIQKNIDIIIISTTNNMLAPIASDAIRAGKHVLIEKPGAIHYSELDALILLAKKYNVCVKIGYNLRYHPAIRKSIEMFHNKDIGNIMYMKINYGHGGRLGYEKEWRSNPKISGGGELIDQGCHTLDLATALLGELHLKSGVIKTYFWDMPVEDNAFVTVENYLGEMAFIQVSCTEWKNTFCMEIYGKKGKLRVDGLGGSYGIEKLTYYKMSPEMGIPEITSWEYPKPDVSFETEFCEFAKAIEENMVVWSSLKDSRNILRIVDAIYERNK